MNKKQEKICAICVRGIMVVVLIMWIVKERRMAKNSEDLVKQHAEVVHISGQSAQWANHFIKADDLEKTGAKKSISDAEITAHAQMVRVNGHVEQLDATDHEFCVVAAEANEKLAVELTLTGPDDGTLFRIEADNGGILRWNGLPKGNHIEFTYILGGNPGKYSVYVLKGRRQEVLTFWVGKEAPMGALGSGRNIKTDEKEVEQ